MHFKAQKCGIHTSIRKDLVAVSYGDNHSQEYHQFSPKKMTAIFMVFFLLDYFKNSFIYLFGVFFLASLIKSD